MLKSIIYIPVLFLLTANFTSNTGDNIALISSDRRVHPFQGAHIKEKGIGNNSWSVRIRYVKKLDAYEEIYTSSGQFSPDGGTHTSKKSSLFYVYSFPEAGPNIYIAVRQGSNDKEIEYSFLEVAKDNILFWNPRSCENGPGVIKTKDGNCIFSTPVALLRAMLDDYRRSNVSKTAYKRD
jgi:hypothetical protein